MGDFTSLEIYCLAEDLSVKIFGITSQLRRAVTSIALNIAESYGRFYYKDKAVFLYNARGSLLETKSIVLICGKLGYIVDKEKDELLSEIERLGVKINNYIKYLKQPHDNKSTT